MKTTIATTNNNNMEQTNTVTLKIEATADKIGLKMDIDRNSFALALRTWRTRAGLSQTEAGKIMGVSRWAILKLEKAQPTSWETAYKVFAILMDKLKVQESEMQPW